MCDWIKCCGLVALLLNVDVAFAGNVWDGGGSNNNWSTGANWNSDNSPPANNGLIDIVMSGNTRLTPTVDVAYSIHSLFFLNAGAFTLGGQTLTIGAGGITQGDAQSQAINTSIAMSASQTWDANAGPLVFGAGSVFVPFTTTLTFSGAFATTIQGPIAGSGNLVKFGNGTLTLAGTTANTYTGSMTVNSGTLRLAKTASVNAIAGSLTIGDGVGSDVVQLSQDEQIANGASVTISSSGTLDLAGHTETVGGVNLSGGNISNTADGLLRTSGLVMTGGGIAGPVETSQISILASPTSSVIAGPLYARPGEGAVNLIVADGPAVDDLIAGATSAIDFNKLGPGQLVLTNQVSAGQSVLGAGTVLLNSPFLPALIGHVWIGDGGGDAVDVVRCQRDGQIDGSAWVNIVSTGLLDLNGQGNDFATLAFAGGSLINAGPVFAARLIVESSGMLAGSGSINIGTSSIAESSTLTLANAGTTTFLGGHAHQAGAALSISAGTVRFNQDARGATGARNLSISIIGATTQLQFVSSQHLAALEIHDGRTTMVPGGGDRVLVTDLLSVDIGDASLDVGDHALLVDYTSTSPYATVRSQLLSGRNGGAWDGLGINSSAAAAQTARNTALGLMEAVDYLALYPAAPFEGETLDGSAVLVKYTYYGDADFNGIVNFDDYARIDSGFNNGESDWLNGDFDLNGVVNFDDYALIDLSFNTQSGTLLRGVSTVPEPRRFCACLLGVCGLLRHSRRAALR